MEKVIKNKYYILFIALVLFSCNKPDKALFETPEFKDVVGTWVSLSDQPITIEIKTSGKIITRVRAGRPDKFQTNDLIIDPTPIDGTFNLTCWDYNQKRNTFTGAVSMHKTWYSDTARIYTAQVDSAGFAPVNESNYNLYYRQK